MLALSRHMRRQLSSVPNLKVKLLVVDGYAKSGREALEKGGMLTAGDLYKRMFSQISDQLNQASTSNPQSKVEIETHVVYPADAGYYRPDLSEFDGVGWTGSSLTVYHSE